MGSVENQSIVGWVQGSRPANSVTTGKVRILIVEDDAPLAQMLVFLLMRFGCEVQTVHTGKEGMQLAQKIRFDLITLDIDLPDADGFSICSKLKHQDFTRNTPIVFISGRSLEGNAERSLELGAVDYITKPFGVEFASRLLSHIKHGQEASAAGSTDK
jgi:DNA-binding response OmpR family regulator